MTFQKMWVYYEFKYLKGDYMKNRIEVHDVHQSWLYKKHSEEGIMERTIIYQHIPSEVAQTELYILTPDETGDRLYINTFNIRGKMIAKFWYRNSKIVSLEEFIKMLKAFFARGRILTGIHRNGRNIFSSVENAISEKIPYAAVKKILKFENRASRKLEDEPFAVKEMNPRVIKLNRFKEGQHGGGYVDLGDYTLESWGSLSKSHYSYLTFNRDTANWLDRMTYPL